MPCWAQNTPHVSSPAVVPEVIWTVWCEPGRLVWGSRVGEALACCPSSRLSLQAGAHAALYTLSKHHFVLVFIVFFVCFV